MSKTFKNEVCHWCNKPISYSDPSVVVRDDELMHLSCAAEEDDDAMFDRDMEFGDN